MVTTVRWLASLRVRVALFFTVLLALVLGISFFMVSAANLRIFHQQAAQELQTGEKVFRRLLELNDRQLQQAASVLAADFGFRAALASGDRATMQSALQNQGSRIKADLVLLSDLQGQVLAGSVPVSRYPFPELLQQAGHSGFASGIKVLGRDAYEVIMVPVKAPLVIGWVTMGVRVDQRMASELKALSGLEVSFLHSAPQWHLLASTLAPAAAQELLAAPQRMGSDRIELQALPYQSRLLPIGRSGGSPLYALLQRPLQEILAPFYSLQQAMAGLALAALLLCVIGSVSIARIITQPLQRLVSAAVRIRDGDYSQHIAEPDTRELAQLAGSLSHMQQAIALREGEILALAYRDSLTGLANRAGFVRQLEQHLLDGVPALTVLLLDIDRFQLLNDTLGHPFGDQVICRVGQTLQATAEAHGALLARLGGDEFALLLAADPAGTQALLAAVQHGFERQLTLDERVVDVRASIGVAAYPLHAPSATDLLRCADEAMYVAKRNKSVTAVYDAAKRQFRDEHLSLLGDLKRAVEQDQLMLHLQPKVALDGSPVREAEALVRWQHPQRGFVPPFEFIPYAEQTGYIRALSNWVIARACHDAAYLAAQGFPTRLSVNLSTRDLLDPGLPHYVAACLASAGLPVAMLCLEITESGVMEDPARALETLHALRDMGLALAIDDYGTGYSSLAYIKQLPVSELKIDRAFVKEVAQSAADAMIVRSTVELAHSLGFKVVAEGVETADIDQLLREMGCDYVQGYFYSRPLAREAYLAWLRARSA